MERGALGYSPGMLLWAIWGAAFCVGAAILLAHAALGVGTVRNRLRDGGLQPREHLRIPGGAASPHATVVVASKDEALVLPALLNSLERQTLQDFDIVLVDDRSTDGTGAVMEGFRSRSSRPVSVLRNAREPEGTTGKVQALDLAVAASTGEVLVFTDSDCTVPPTWVEGHLSYYAQPRVGVVFGQIVMPPSRRFLESYQAFDQRLIHQYSSGSAGLGLPTGCFGNNLSARREAVNAIGGFRGLGYTVTEDAALIAAVGKSRRWRVLASTRAELTVLTRPQSTWRDFVNQHTRWNIGGFYSSDRATRTGYRFLVLYLTASVLVLPAAMLFPLLCVFALNAFVSVGLLAVLDATIYPRRTWRDRLVAVPFTLFFLLFYSLVTVRAIARKRPEWKGSRLDVKG